MVPLTLPQFSGPKTVWASPAASWGLAHRLQKPAGQAMFGTRTARTRLELEPHMRRTSTPETGMGVGGATEPADGGETRGGTGRPGDGGGTWTWRRTLTREVGANAHAHAGAFRTARMCAGPPPLGGPPAALAAARAAAAAPPPLKGRRTRDSVRPCSCQC